MATLVPAPVGSKSPNERLVYEIDWAPMLPESVSLSSSTWSATGDDTLVLTGPAIVGSVARVRIDAGTVDVKSQVTNLVELSNGERLEACITIYVRSPCASGC
jgi:hypothetical protein